MGKNGDENLGLFYQALLRKSREGKGEQMKRLTEPGPALDFYGDDGALDLSGSSREQAWEASMGEKRGWPTSFGQNLTASGRGHHGTLLASSWKEAGGHVERRPNPQAASGFLCFFCPFQQLMSHITTHKIWTSSTTYHSGIDFGVQKMDYFHTMKG
jgi:hypothetical protein